MEMKGQRFHLNELGIENNEVRMQLMQERNNQIVVEVCSLFREEYIENLIQGSSLDKELAQPIPPLMTVSNITNLKDAKTVIKYMHDGLVKMNEYFVIEPVLNWFGEPIDSYFRIVDVSE